MFNPEGALVIQADRSVLLEVHAPRAREAAAALARFAELEKSPEHVHTYRLTPLSLWNAAAAGLGAPAIVAALAEHARYPLPQNVVTDVLEMVGRWGKLRLLPALPGRGEGLHLQAEEGVRKLVSSTPAVAKLLRPNGEGFLVDPKDRGSLKQQLVRLGWPVDDRAGFDDGAPLGLALRDPARSGKPFALRDYQRGAAEAFLSAAAGGGHGVVVLPCGAGKTVVGMAVMQALSTQTLILVTSVVAARQWISELLDKTTLEAADVGEYHGEAKAVRPVTVATYNILTHRARAAGGAEVNIAEEFPHFQLFSARPWGLIVYDEVHLLPAPVFRMTAGIQAKRRLGLTATLVREDGKEGDVFSLIGPKRSDVPWKEMEEKGHIAQAACYEIRVDLAPPAKLDYAAAPPRARHRIAACNPKKREVVQKLLHDHRGDRVLVIGQYLDELHEIAGRHRAPIVTGATPEWEREERYAAFRAGEVPVLVVSRVANFSIDLPDANVCIQVSGSFGSRQEEAQRLGRILRPKAKGAFFYSVVTRETVEQEFAMHRQLFLCEQGYRYFIEDFEPRGVEAAAGPALAPAEEGARAQDAV
jgi:DNA excision repair protein ERCC-3